MKNPSPVLVLLSLVLGGCVDPWEERVSPEARAALENADRVTLVSLVPAPSVEARRLAPGEDEFRGFRVLGRAELVDLSSGAELIGLLRDGIQGSDGAVALCFSPRHGVSVVSGVERVELVICFECLQVRVHGPEGPARTVPISESVEPQVSRLYRSIGLAIHGDPAH